MLPTKGYFIKNKRIYDVGLGSHIRFIMDNPRRFKYTKNGIKTIYDQFGEPYGFEGKARKVIMAEVIYNGWIRVRQKDRNGTWVMEFKSMVEARPSIWHFLEHAIGEAGVMKADDALYLNGIIDGCKLEYLQPDGGASTFFIDTMCSGVTATIPTP